MGRLSWIVSAKRGIRNQFEFARPGRRSSSARKKLSRGASLRGQGTPADPARLRSERARNSSKTLYIAGRENLGSFWPADLPSFADFRIAVPQEVAAPFPKIRSEERRVGKE